MHLREYDAQKRGLDRLMFAGLYPRLRPFLTAPFSAASAALNPVELTVLLARTVLDFQFRSGSLAREFYDSERERVTGLRDRHDFYVSTTRPEFVTRTLGLVVGEFEERLELAFSDDPVPDRPDPETEIGKVISHSVTLASHGERATVKDAVRSDPACLGWARVDPEPPSCGFCTMLISRGPVYKTAETAGDERNVFHPNDTCRTVPVFDSNDWSGRAAFEAAQDAYAAASRDARETGESITAILDRRRRNR